MSREVSDNVWLILNRGPRDLALFWEPNRCGYTVRLDDAGHYSEAEAKRQERRRDTDHAVPLALAERMAVRVVSQEDLLKAIGDPHLAPLDPKPEESDQ